MIGFLYRNVRWLGVGALLAFASSFGQTFFIAIFAGEVRGFFGLTHGSWGIIYMCGTLSSAILMLWSGALTDRHRVRILGPIFLVLLAGSCLFMAINPVVWLLPLVIFCLRFTGQGMLSHISVVAMSRWYVANRGKAVAISHLGYSFGEALLPMLFIALLGYFAWNELWVMSAVFLLFLAPVLWVMLGEERSPQSQAEESASLGMMGAHWTRQNMLAHPLFWMMLPALIGPSTFVTAYFFLQEHYAQISGITHFQLASLFPLYTVVAVSMIVLSGIALDLFGAHRLVAFHQIPMAIGFFLAGSFEGLDGVVLGLMFLALSTGSYATLINGFWAEFYGTKHLGSVKAIGMSVMVLGSSIGPALIGVFLDLGVTLNQQFKWISVFFCLSTILMMVGIRRARSSLPGSL